MCCENRTAVLFVHGILGTPKHFEPYLPLIPADWTVCNLLLKGHGGSVRDFSRATMAEWKQQVQQALDALLRDNHRVIVVAHSMGTLFAIQEAITRPIAALFLLNIPLRIHIRARLFQMIWRIFRGTIDPENAWLCAAQNAYSIEPDPHIFRYLGWIPRYLELFSEIKKTRKIAQKLSIPAHLYFSRHDEMVSCKSCELCKNHTMVTVTMLENSGHFYYAPADQARLLADFEAMIRGITEAQSTALQ